MPITKKPSIGKKSSQAIKRRHLKRGALKTIKTNDPVFESLRNHQGSLAQKTQRNSLLQDIFAEFKADRKR
jgi:DNA-directed RNA polymerase subunit H (RpoH/RPB5)